MATSQVKQLFSFMIKVQDGFLDSKDLRANPRSHHWPGHLIQATPPPPVWCFTCKMRRALENRRED